MGGCCVITVFDPVAYERVSDGSFFCGNCLWRWLQENEPAPHYRPCSSFAILAEQECLQCGVRFVRFFREREEDELVTMYDDPFAFIESDRDW